MLAHLSDIFRTSIDQRSQPQQAFSSSAVLSTVLTVGIAAMGAIGCDHHSHAHDAHDIHVIMAGGPAFSAKGMSVAGGIEVAGHPAGEGINGNRFELAGEFDVTHRVEGEEQGTTHVVGKIMMGGSFEWDKITISLTPFLGAGVETDWAFNTQPIVVVGLEGAVVFGKESWPVRPVLKAEAEGHVNFKPTQGFVTEDGQLAIKTGIAF